MPRSAGFMTRSGRAKTRVKKSRGQLVAPANGPYISQVRREPQNHGANRAKNRVVHEH